MASFQELNIQSLPRKVGPPDFERVKLIGQGDVGKVYLVRLKSTRSLFAMKILSKTEMIARNKLKRCLTEREILATVDNPFIVTLYYCFQSPDHLFLVMDYCAGGEFFRMLKSQRDRRIPEEWVKFYGAEVLLALEYLHSCGFIYRDLKPENILLHDSGHVMLTDFDLSKQASITTAMVKEKPSLLGSLMGGGSANKGRPAGQIVIDSNSFVGTEEYIAPEVIKGSEQSSAIDWWTFGILIFEMAFGFTPFKGPTQNETFNNICTTDRVTIPERPETTAGLKKMVRGLLARDPAKRLGSKGGAAEVRRCELGKTAVAIKDGVGTAASAVASEIADVAQHIKDTVEGVSSYEIPIKDFIGIQDYAGNQSKRTKHGPDLAARLLAIQYRTHDHPLELVAATQEDKNRWIEALLELKYLADDAGTDVLVFQREKEEKAQRIKETIDQRKEERLNKVLHEAAAKKDSEDGGSRAKAVASASLKMGGASRIPSASLGGTSPGNASPKPIASASLGGRAHRKKSAPAIGGGGGGDDD